MMGAAAIRSYQESAARQAARERLTPFVFFVSEPEAIANEMRRGGADFPFMGTYVGTKDGWSVLHYRYLGWESAERTYRHGWYGSDRLGIVLFYGGSDSGEPALGPVGFGDAAAEIIARVREVDPKATVGFAVYEAGQFQVNIRVYWKRI